MKASGIGCAIVAFFLTTLGLIGLVIFGVLSSMNGSGACLQSINGLGAVKGLDADQLANARTIIATGAAMGVPARGIEIALATAMQESTLHNLDHGNQDSVGLFQQRPSAGWGTIAQLTTPEIAAQKFYSSLLKVPGWQSIPLTQAAQKVQRSAFPFAYAKWESLATALVSAAGAGSGAGSVGSAAAAAGAAVAGAAAGAGAANGAGAAVGSAAAAGAAGGAEAAGIAGLNCSSSLAYPTPPGAVGDMLRAALAQQGKPYVWGATGPDAFDCSGLVVFSWRKAGYRVTVRTAAQMYDVAAPVAFGQEQPGDLIFGEFGPTPSGAHEPGHVMIVVTPGIAVEAPHTGDVVKLVPYSNRGGWILGRLTTASLVPIPGLVAVGAAVGAAATAAGAAAAP